MHTLKDRNGTFIKRLLLSQMEKELKMHTSYDFVVHCYLWSLSLSLRIVLYGRFGVAITITTHDKVFSHCWGFIFFSNLYYALMEAFLCYHILSHHLFSPPMPFSLNYSLIVLKFKFRPQCMWKQWTLHTEGGCNAFSVLEILAYYQACLVKTILRLSILINNEKEGDKQEKSETSRDAADWSFQLKESLKEKDRENGRAREKSNLQDLLNMRR